jgi:predicted acetyltransferase
MDYRKLLNKDIPQAKALWKQAFGDSDGYIDFNFKYNLTLENSFGIYNEYKLVCMLFMLPKILINGDKKMSTYFIVGVSTDNEYRKKGYARDIMAYAKDYLNKNNVPLVFLYPFNHEFYKKLDYHTISHMRKIEFDKKTNNDNSKYKFSKYSKDNKPDISILLGLYNEYAKTKESYFLRTKEDYEVKLETMQVDGGEVLIITKNNKPVGYVLYFIEEDKFNCLESIFLSKNAAEKTLEKISEQYAGYIYLDKSFDVRGSKKEEYVMMQIIDGNSAGAFYGVNNLDELLNIEVMILEQY